MFCCCQLDSSNEITTPLVEIQSVPGFGLDVDEGRHDEADDAASQLEPKPFEPVVEAPSSLAAAEAVTAASPPAKRADGSAPASSALSSHLECPGPVRISGREFAITIEKDGTAGLDISTHDGKTLLIGKVKDGPFLAWNQAVGPNRFEQVRRGDRIIEVNGCADDSQAVLKVMAESRTLNVKIRRLVEFRVACDKGDDLGAEFDRTVTEDLIIASVTGGQFMQANKKNKVDMEMRSGDQIAEVNGQCGSAKTLTDLLQNRGSLDIVIRRPST